MPKKIDDEYSYLPSESMRYRRRHPERAKANQRRYYRKNRKELLQSRLNNRLRFKGKNVVVRKRKYYGICELCGNPVEHNPRWHHWDDEHLEWGLWLDWRCHHAVEAAEQAGVVIPLYDKLKELIESRDIEPMGD